MLGMSVGFAKIFIQSLQSLLPFTPECDLCTVINISLFLSVFFPFPLHAYSLFNISHNGGTMSGPPVCLRSRGYR